MLQGTPSHELDRIIEAAVAAQATLRKMLDGLEPDENGVVTVTTEAAADSATVLQVELADLVDVGMVVAGTVEDLHPTTADARASLRIVADRLERRLDRDSVGHTHEELGAADAVDDSVAVEITPAEEPPRGPSFYGV